MATLNYGLCVECNKPIPIRNKFCNSSCAAKYNNRYRSLESRAKQKESIRKKYNTQTTNCIQCNSVFTMNSRTRNLFCSAKCHKTHRRQNYIDKILNFEPVGHSTLKKYLIEIKGYKCSECGIDKWNDKAISLEMDHKDGDPSNHILPNVRLLCPNCHSQTSTYKNKGKGKKILKGDNRSTYHRNRKRIESQEIKMARSEGLEPPLMLSPPATVTTV